MFIYYLCLVLIIMLTTFIREFRQQSYDRLNSMCGHSLTSFVLAIVIMTTILYCSGKLKAHVAQHIALVLRQIIY